MSEGKTIRAFLAIDPSEEVLRSIADIQGILKRNIRGSISWVRPEGIHLTLKFFGDIGREHLLSIAEVVTVHAAATPPLNLFVQGLGVFPAPRRPRVLWIGVGGDTERLIALQKAVDQGLETCGFRKEERPFQAHLTLARIKSPQGLAGIEKMLTEKGSEGAGAFKARSVTLFQSELTPKGAIYTVLGNFPFQD